MSQRISLTFALFIVALVALTIVIHLQNQRIDMLTSQVNTFEAAQTRLNDRVIHNMQAIITIQDMLIDRLVRPRRLVWTRPVKPPIVYTHTSGTQ